MRNRLPQHTWVGESGEQYAYFIREWPTRLAAVPGNYILARAGADAAWLPVLIGESADLSVIAKDERVQWSLAHDLFTHIHTRANLNPSSARRREVSDLLARWNPPANRRSP